MFPPFVCGIMTDHVVAEGPALLNMLVIYVTLDVSHPDKSAEKVEAL